MTPMTSTMDCAPSCSRSTISPRCRSCAISWAISASRHPNLDAVHTAHELVRRLITRLIEDVIAEAGDRLAALSPHGADDVRHAAAPVAGFSPAMAEADRAIKGFLYPRMYRHARIARIMSEAEAVVRDLFARYAASPQDIPADWAHGAAPGEEAARLRRSPISSPA